MSVRQESIPQAADAWAPLRHAAFRGLWIAITISNVGTWMHDMAAAWLMTTLTQSSLLIALVQTAAFLPFFLLALPAGTLADIVDRRVYLMVAAAWMIAAALALGAFTFAGLMTPGLLLLLIFLLGSAGAMMRPAMAAIVPDLVPRAELRQAITLNTMSLNLSRAVGPILAGLVIISAGPGAVFLLNAAGLAVLLVAIHRLPRDTTRRHGSLPVERFIEGFRAGIRFTRHAPALQAVLLKGAVFFFFAGAVWALLPVIAVRVLEGGPAVYGLLVALMGSGAVIAAQFMARINARYSRNAVITGAGVVYAVAMFLVADTRHIAVMGAALLVSGAAWLAYFASISAAGQMAVPDWVRARGLSMVMLVIMGSAAAGAPLWGRLVDVAGLSQALMLAGAGLGLSMFVVARFRLEENDHVDLTPSLHWPTPEYADGINPDRGPVMVTVEYVINKENEPEFLSLARELQRLRRRDGAFFWEMFRRATADDHFVEMFMVDSWLEHLRQHQRVTVADKLLQDRIGALHAAKAPPEIHHYIA
ncbi:MAG TPA: MFS transporter [Gammaproteobacteria bacterium]